MALEISKTNLFNMLESGIVNLKFIKTDGTETTLALVNNKDMTTINGFLDHVVVQSYYLPFTTANGTSVQTIRPGHMPTLEGI